MAYHTHHIECEYAVARCKLFNGPDMSTILFIVDLENESIQSSTSPPHLKPHTRTSPHRQNPFTLTDAILAQMPGAIAHANRRGHIVDRIAATVSDADGDVADVAHAARSHAAHALAASRAFAAHHGVRQACLFVGSNQMEWGLILYVQKGCEY